MSSCSNVKLNFSFHDEDIIVSSDGVTFQRIPAKQVIAENPVFQD